MNIIDERDVRTVYRKLRKKEYDDMISLSVSSGQEVRLLDEGMVVDAYGRPLFYIMKGTLEKYMNALTDDYVGSINLGHMDFATFPILLGEWTKNDLSLVDIGDGRKGLNVNLRLDEDNFLVKELKRANYDLGVSAEFGYHVNEEFSEKFGVEILDDLFISNFAVVGEAGNVNSSGIKLGGNMTVKDLTAAIESSTVPDLSEINKKLDAMFETPEKELTVEEPVAEPVEETVEEPEADLSVVLSTVTELRDQIQALTAENESLKAQLDSKNKAEREFIEKFKSLSVSLKQEEAPKQNKIVFTDGIGA